LIQLKPKLVIELGSLSTTVAASPPFDGGGGGGSTGGGTGITGGTGSGGGGLIGGGTPPPVTVPSTTPTQPGVSNNQTPTTISPTAQSLPPLGDVPKWFIVGALVLAALCAWLMQSMGALLLGGRRSCDIGLTTGVPDLRKG
jgi:hypothetical protein